MVAPASGLFETRGSHIQGVDQPRLPAAHPSPGAGEEGSSGGRSQVSVLILNSDLPGFPGQAGHEYLNTTNLARLVDDVGIVSLVHSNDQEKHADMLRGAGVHTYVWSRPASDDDQPHAPRSAPRTVLQRAVSVLLRTRSATRPPEVGIQNLQFRNIAPQVLAALADGPWQCVVIVQSWSAPWIDYIPPFPTSALVLHDVRSILYRRRVSTGRTFSQRLGYLFDALRYWVLERHYCRQFDLVITVSPDDEAWVRAHYRPHRLITIPIPVDAGYFAARNVATEVTSRIVFTGTMNHPPNVDAAVFFARQVFPRVRARLPQAEFWVVGRDASLEVQALSSLPGVTITGAVPDIRDYIAAASVVVVPLRYGSGLRNKILEAWSMQKCVVSTAVGAEGLRYVDGQNILIANGAEQLADRVVRALNDAPLRESVRKQGFTVVKAMHDPSTIAERYAASLSFTLNDKQSSPVPMRVLVDLRWMVPGVAGGIENLARSFIGQLLRLDASNCYTLLVPPEVRFDFDLRTNPNVRVHPMGGPDQDRRVFARRLDHLLHRWAGRDFWRSPQVDDLSFLHRLQSEVGLSIPGYIHPELFPLSNVLVVPDIQHEYHPEFFSQDALAERRRLYTDSIHRATRVCAISEFTRQTLIERLGVSPDKVITTPLAADPLFEARSHARRNADAVIARHGLARGEYLIFPGNTWRHKNHQAALKALHVLAEHYHLRPLLVCTGAPKEAHSTLLEQVRRLKLEKQVRFLGYRPADEMPALYEGAAALIFPSLFEGFGMPVLEAMWCECPVVCSNTSSLPEIAGDAALLVDPESTDEISDALARVLTDTSLRTSLIEHGREQARRFSWRQFTLDVVRTLHDARNVVYGHP